MSNLRQRHSAMPRFMHSSAASQIQASSSTEASPNAPNGAFFGGDLPLGLRCVKRVVGGVFATCRNPNVIEMGPSNHPKESRSFATRFLLGSATTPADPCHSPRSSALSRQLASLFPEGFHQSCGEAILEAHYNSPSHNKSRTSQPPPTRAHSLVSRILPR